MLFSTSILPYTALPHLARRRPHIPGKAGSGCRHIHRALLPPHPIHRTVGISPGEGLGEGNAPPRQVKPHCPSHRAPAQERGFSWQEPGWGANPGKGNPDLAFHRHLATHRSPISPTPPAPPALLPRPRGRGQCRRYPRKGRLGMPAHTLPSSHPTPYTGPWGYHPGRGSGRGTPLPAR